jgi:hypothetical protein
MAVVKNGLKTVYGAEIKTVNEIIEEFKKSVFLLSPAVVQ